MIFMKIMMTVGPEVIVNKEQWSYDECIFFFVLETFFRISLPCDSRFCSVTVKFVQKYYL